MAVLRQPFLGIVSTLLVLGLSFGFISLFDGPTFTGWISYYLMCTIPASLVIAGVWAGKYPRFAAGSRQPLRGALLLLTALAVGLVVAALHFVTVGGAVHPPLPILVQSIVISVVVAFWMTIVWEGWPFTLIRNPLVAGISLLIGYYVVSNMLFRIFFNYEFLRGSPFYRAELDPTGMFDAWSAIAFAVTAAGTMFLMLHFELWPLTRFPAVMRQPVLGFVWSAIVLVAGAIVFTIATRACEVDAPVLLTKVSIPFIFGTIIVLNMLEGSLFSRFSQPIKGVCSALVAAVVGTALARVYGSLAPVLTGPVPAGPPEYAYEVWLASALLAVTFPFLAFDADFFQMWPLRRKRATAPRHVEAYATTLSGRDAL